MSSPLFLLPKKPVLFIHYFSLFIYLLQYPQDHHGVSEGVGTEHESGNIVEVEVQAVGTQNYTSQVTAVQIKKCIVE